MKIAKDQRNIRAEKIVSEFLRNGGYVVVYSNDHNFIKVIRNVITKQLNINHDCFFSSAEELSIYNVLKRKSQKEFNIILFVENEIHRSSTKSFIRFIMMHYEKIHIVVLTTEVEQSELIYLYELGVQNFITKPLTVNTLVEKFANTVKPPSGFAKDIERAKELIAAGDLQQALDLVEALVEQKPNSPAANMLKGDIYLKMDKKQDAIQSYEAAHNAEKLYLEPIKRMVGFFQQTGNEQKQLDQLKKLDRLSPLNVERKMHIGELFLRQDKTEEAEQYFQESVKITKKQMKNKVANINMEIAELLMDKNPEKAEEYLRQALETKKDTLDKEDIHLFNRLGMSLRKQKKPQEAITEYKKALKVSPEDENLYYNIALAYQEDKKFAKSENYIRKVLGVNPNIYKESEVVAYNIGLIFYSNRLFDQALPYVQYALELNPNYSNAQRLLTQLEKT
ncbi:MAG: tetratricopeptide repeat protein [Desulfohalobiaceae bacterium]